MGAKATHDGLQICPSGHGTFINADNILKDNSEVIVYCGYAMACITGSFYQPLLHRVDLNLNDRPLEARMSMPFFLRLNKDVRIPVMDIKVVQSHLAKAGFPTVRSGDRDKDEMDMIKGKWEMEGKEKEKGKEKERDLLIGKDREEGVDRWITSWWLLEHIRVQRTWRREAKGWNVRFLKHSFWTLCDVLFRFLPTWRLFHGAYWLLTNY